MSPYFDLARDPKAPRSALAIVVVLSSQGLLTEHYQRIKLVTIAHLAGISIGRASFLMRWLTKKGHLEMRHDEDFGREYRLPDRRKG